MLPTGDREVMWRYTREVFQNTTREELDRSIAARNEREDGLSQEWVLRKQYPNMTDQEIKNAMSGFSPRVVQNAAVGIQTTLQLFQQFLFNFNLKNGGFYVTNFVDFRCSDSFSPVFCSFCRCKGRGFTFADGVLAEKMHSFRWLFLEVCKRI
jgi:hypothetical protein